MKSAQRYACVTVGGTFDHFHLGHKALLARAFEIGQKVYLGITTDEYVTKSLSKVDTYAYLIEPYEERKAILEQYINSQFWQDRIEIIGIDDKYGTTLSDEDLESIVVSPETESVAVEINLLRTKKGWKELYISKVDWILAADGLPIHSTRIRKGEIGEGGESFSLPSDWGVRKITDTLRVSLKKPLGTLIVDKNHNFDSVIEDFLKQYAAQTAEVISVGDAVTNSLLAHNTRPKLAVIDLHVQRHKLYENVADIGFKDVKVLKNLKNPAGTVSYEAFKIVSELVHLKLGPNVLQVEGEEDLLALLAILSAPLQSIVVYGQPHEGIVVVVATQEKKREVMEYLRGFQE